MEIPNEIIALSSGNSNLAKCTRTSLLAADYSIELEELNSIPSLTKV